MANNNKRKTDISPSSLADSVFKKDFKKLYMFNVTKNQVTRRTFAPNLAASRTRTPLPKNSQSIKNPEIAIKKPIIKKDGVIPQQHFPEEKNNGPTPAQTGTETIARGHPQMTSSP
ncbi:hypothetical protein TKK_0019103 [Trichogramma kaykai]